ncbi:GNAT family N-acetyltransferase [Lentzea sp. NPDC102401]|uniref:GNAT family N-acetyltransferase n=1 Tax=Lentzea sp. NPDC102401 TaxID=3364128 RepID=UPI0037FF1FC3
MMTLTESNITLVDAAADKTYPLSRLEQAGITVNDVAGLLATAFFDTPQAEWLVPSAAERFGPLQNHFALGVKYALLHGHIDLRSDMRAVAVWVHASDGYLPAPEPDYDELLKQGTGPHYERFETFDSTMAAYHPDGVGRQYLECVGVLPDFQGYGYGTALLDLNHRRLDEMGMPAFLEAATTRNVAHYQRHGYNSCGTYNLPLNGPAMHRMWREPRRVSDLAT